MKTQFKNTFNLLIIVSSIIFGVQQISAMTFNNVQTDSNTTYSSDTDGITKIYEDCLGREPESGGLEHHLGLLSQGMSIAEIKEGICNSEEAKNKEEAGADDQSTSDQFLWKPESDSDGKLVILLPNSMKGQVSSVSVQSGQTQETGKFSGDSHNGNRPHFRFSKPGADYGSNIMVIAAATTGMCSWIIPNGADRFEAGEGNCGADAMMGGAFGSGAGGFIYNPSGESTGYENILPESSGAYCGYGQKTVALSKNIKVMMMGDSNTVGVGNPGTSDQTNVIGFRKYLKDTLTTNGVTVDFVGSQCNGSGFMSDCQHEGYSGKGIAQLQSRVNSGAIRSYKPDVVTILVGSNDMWVSLSNRSPISDSLAQTRVADLGRLIDSIHKDAPEAQIIVAKPATPSSATRPLGIYRNGIDTLATSRSYMKVVDFSGFSNDGTHYRPDGFKKIASSLASKIIDGRSVCVDVETSATTTTATSTTTNYPAGCTSLNGYSSTTGLRCNSATNTTATATNGLSATCFVSDRSIEVGEETNINVKISGGNDPYKIRWGGETSKIKSLSKTKNDRDIEFKSSGIYDLEVRVTDDDDVQVTALCSPITVYAVGASVQETVSNNYPVSNYVPPTSFNYYRDLTIGSEGSDVSALQDFLIARGYLTMPAGVPKGYFGNLTRDAVARWQLAVGLTPPAGYFGAKSRAAISGTTVTAPVYTAPAYVAPVTPTYVTPASSNVPISCVNVNRTMNYEETSADVIAVQNFLISKGYLTMPAGVAKGYYGNLTATAIANYMASKNVSTSGITVDYITLQQIRRDSGCAN